MRAIVSLLVFAATLMVVESNARGYQAGDSCANVQNESNCNAAYSDDDGTQACAWCAPASFPNQGNCYTTTDAQTLDNTAYTCSYHWRGEKVTDSDSCANIQNESNCNAAYSDDDGTQACAWCSPVGNPGQGTCYTTSDAEGLDTTQYSCSYHWRSENPLKTSACESVSSEKTCMTTTAGSEKCAWCNSAAVGGTCFLESDAKTLPSSVFQCEYQKAKLRATACDSITAEKTCLTESANGEKCAWCHSAAVGNTCFPESDAKTLPTSVFQCEYQTPASFL